MPDGGHRRTVPRMSKPVGRLAVAVLAVLAVGAGLVGCTAESVTVATPTADPLPIVQGTWTYTTSHADLQKNGVTDAGALDTNASSSVMTIQGSRFTVRATPEAGFDVDEEPTTGRITAAGGAVTFHWGQGDRTRATPHRLGNGEVEFTDVATSDDDPQTKAIDRAIFTERPWTPLADAIEGAWTVVVRADDLRLAGVPDPTAQDGRVWLQLTNGQWQSSISDDPEAAAPDSTGAGYGDYTLQGERLVLIDSSGPKKQTVAVDVLPNPEGGLTFSDVATSANTPKAVRAWADVALTAEPWERPD